MTNSELKSNVMTLGNKPAPRMGGDRRAAFVQAWIIVQAGGLELAVRGVYPLGTGRKPCAAWPLTAPPRSRPYWSRNRPTRQTPPPWRSWSA